MKLALKKKDRDEKVLVEAIVGNGLTASIAEPYTSGTYLEAWYRALKLSKEYTQSCRTGIFPSESSFNTFCLFGCIENCSFRQWWLDRGFDVFRYGLTSLRLRLVVNHKCSNAYGITLDAYEEASDQLVGEEFRFLMQQIKILNANSGLLSAAPMAWAVYSSRITFKAITLYLDVLEAYEKIIQNSPEARLWCIGEQLKLNPKAMTKPSDTPKESTDKHITMGRTVHDLVRKGHDLVCNACHGNFPHLGR